MTLDQFITARDNTPKGANVILAWTRTAKTRAKITDKVQKRVRMAGRFNIDYDKIKNVQEKRENGELPTKNAGLPWGEWVEFPNLIVHKEQYYGRFYTSTNDKAKSTVQWLLNGVEVPFETVKPLILASEYPRSDADEEKLDTFNVKLQDIEQIHHTMSTDEVPQETGDYLGKLMENRNKMEDEKVPF